ncbi:hypothetical protein IPN35_04335 [Candidatus Peregrinibacteria bacterium]|nr:MAG: hypothetical protein IPN35_04335 [Candidatus Peregrinibacteria bacterium]
MSSQKTTENGAQNAFFYLTSFFSLSFVAFGVGNLLFSMVHFYFPESTNLYSQDFSQDSLKFGIAALLIASPVYFFTTKTLYRFLAEKKLSYESGIRRWLTYVVLFITIATVLGDLVTTLYSFLGGELTIRFLLKSLIILGISGGIFLFYFLDVHTNDSAFQKMKNRVFTGIFWTVVLLPLFWAFTILENPQITRMKKIDENTIALLQSLQYTVEAYAENEKELPKDIESIASPQYGSFSLQDIKDKNISYTPTSEREYTLCANFERDNQQDNDTSYFGNGNWSHSAGNFCFSLSVKKDNIGKEFIPTPQ